MKTILAVILFLGAVAGGSFGDAPAADPDYTDPDRLSALISSLFEPYLLVDVRTAAEFAAGHIPTALTIPWDTIAAHPPADDRSALIIVYCASGTRSSKAAAGLKALGYSRVVDFGSLSRWEGELVRTD